MRLNRFESLLMNNPARVASQRWLEAAWMNRYAEPVRGGRALEIGCGRGVGIELILEMGAAEVHGFDLDPEVLKATHRRVRPYGNRVLLWWGSATDIPASDASYDAVFDFGVLHHIPNWWEAIAEICRVLRPGGRFLGEEMLRRFITHPIAQALFDHPVHDRFDLAGLLTTLEGSGFRIVSSGQVAECVGWFAAEKLRH
jgi:ubiquinone/menaquinone biosynthesis C-methylase UbiE